MTKTQVDYWKNDILSSQVDIEREKLGLTRELQGYNIDKLKAETANIQNTIKNNDLYVAMAQEKHSWDISERRFNYYNNILDNLPIIGMVKKTLTQPIGLNGVASAAASSLLK